MRYVLKYPHDEFPRGFLDIPESEAPGENLLARYGRIGGIYRTDEEVIVSYADPKPRVELREVFQGLLAPVAERFGADIVRGLDLMVVRENGNGKERAPRRVELRAYSVAKREVVGSRKKTAARSETRAGWNRA